MFSMQKKTTLPGAEEALPGRDEKMPVAEKHYVLNTEMQPPYPDGFELAMFGLGCFWGAERRFWESDGVYSTMVGYAGGYTPNPSYQEVCSGMTGHNEVVRVVYDPRKTNYQDLLKTFWQAHNPTQGMRQGNDVGTQYRSGIYCYSDAQLEQARSSQAIYQQAISHADAGTITTEIIPVPEFYYAEDYHQQYLAKNPGGYCGLGGTGVEWPTE